MSDTNKLYDYVVARLRTIANFTDFIRFLRGILLNSGIESCEIHFSSNANWIVIPKTFIEPIEPLSDTDSLCAVPTTLYRYKIMHTLKDTGSTEASICLFRDGTYFTKCTQLEDWLVRSFMKHFIKLAHIQDMSIYQMCLYLAYPVRSPKRVLYCSSKRVVELDYVFDQKDGLSLFYVRDYSIEQKTTTIHCVATNEKSYYMAELRIFEQLRICTNLLHCLIYDYFKTDSVPCGATKAFISIAGDFANFLINRWEE